MKHALRSRLICLALAAVQISCSRPAGATRQPASQAHAADPAPADRYADDVGRFLAGLPSKPDSPFASLEDQPAWTEHRAASDAAWKHLESGPLPAMRAFQQRELSGAPIATAPVFYPFSGPDALMITLFFPRSPTYYMVGLEPAGTLPEPKAIGRKNLPAYLAGIRTTLASELNSSFFITRQMDRQFRGQITDGLLLPILCLLTRTNHTILAVRYVRLDDAGRIVERAARYQAPGRIGNKGVAIDFQSGDDRSVHKLYYFSVNLDDNHLRENKPFMTFTAGLRGTVTFLKATSYMTHHTEFSMIRGQVLAASLAVLQDDSGIPYRFFAAPWRVQLYGTYVQPYGSFRWLKQRDLQKAYLTTEPKPLEFRIGYGYSKMPSNLLFARKSD